MTPEEFYTNVVSPTLSHVAELAPNLPHHRALKVLMVAISGQEADWHFRSQVPSGMAHGLFQMQLNDVRDIIANPASAQLFKDGMTLFNVKDQSAEAVFAAMAEPFGDMLATFMARLNLWCNPRPIPYADEMGAQFKYYAETWRPAHADWPRWEKVFAEAQRAVPLE